MRILNSNEYMSEKLDIKPVTKSMLSNAKDIHAFIKTFRLIFNPDTNCYDCDGDVVIDKDIIINGRFPIKFGNVNGDFYCCHNGMTTLYGSPKKVGGSFECSDNNLKNLEGAPDVVGYEFNCCDNKLISLNGAPQKVGGSFYCSGNNLTTLKGSPQYVDGDFHCGSNKLVSFDGAPKNVNGNLYCDNNPNLILAKENANWLKGKIINK